MDDPTTPATPADLNEIRALHVESWRRSYRGLLPDALFGAVIETEMAAKWARLGEDRQVTLLRGEDGLLGFAAVYPEHEDGAFVDNLHVRADARRRGLGRVLMRTVARNAGPHPVWLEVLAGNHDARAAYRSWGGAEGRVEDDTVMGVVVPSVIVRWSSGTALLAGLGAR